MKGHDTFRVLDPRTVANLDLTGSGVETIEVGGALGAGGPLALSAGEEHDEHRRPAGPAPAVKG
ncbi:hypothetical protein predicted by Glimmer/Critica [Sorangium cellulosum So ce56]|uniref:Uncharacterized protein n=1 Tax=Sorangium cellulosum (strain So ce56) TaxID=448385 RepID=A9G0R1_SORC5|nr:hypothetical protein predicted by Glimmer/Critica [Sorangium cellulosum So ce56]